MMSDVLAEIYPWVKSLHIVSVISWMAGLFYLPRLFVYHVESVTPESETYALFLKMEHKLLKVIMTPAMIASWIFGLMLVVTPGIVDWSQLWPWIKGASVIGMTAFHFWLSRRHRDFRARRNDLSGRDYRIMNEVPTILMLLIVFSVILKF